MLHINTGKLPKSVQMWYKIRKYVDHEYDLELLAYASISFCSAFSIILWIVMVLLVF